MALKSIIWVEESDQQNFKNVTSSVFTVFSITFPSTLFNQDDPNVIKA